MARIEHIFQHQEKDNKIVDSILHNNEIFTFYKSGNTRYVYVNESKTKVIKTLIRKGHDFNKTEIEIYESADQDTKDQMAETKLVSKGNLIEQEFCKPVDESDKELTIAQMLFASSCRNEVGWNSKGQLVCFDLDEFKKY